MRIVISGTSTINKGAELMLYAILQQIEKKFPNAEIYLPEGSVPEGFKYIKTNLKLRETLPAKIFRVFDKYQKVWILYKLGLSFLYKEKTIKNIDYFIDASGFAFSDQWERFFNDSFLKKWRTDLETYNAQGAKIIFLPQAFGPITKPATKELITNISNFANIIMPRDIISMNYLIDSKVDKNKIQLFPDFTSLVHGTIPKRYLHLEDGVCLIPNNRMIDKGAISREAYLSLMLKIVKTVQKKGFKIFILNHEGLNDEKFAYLIKEKLENNIEVISRLTALEVKGVISTSYLCITSRFHGVASALNSCVPCLSTSWSHKYEELYKDYGLNDGILDILNEESCLNKIDEYLNPIYNNQIREHLKLKLPQIKNQTKKMWDIVWKI